MICWRRGGDSGAIAPLLIGTLKNTRYNIVSVGFIVFGIGLSHADALSGALFYLLHDMIAKH